MMLYLFASWIAFMKHMMLGLTGACNNIAIYLGHYQQQIDGKIEFNERKQLVIVHQADPVVPVDHEEMT